MKKFILIPLLLIYSLLTAKTIYLSNQPNDSDIQPAFQAAVNSAVDGDVIVPPLGIFVVNKTILISKFISIRGKKGTVFYRSETMSDAFLESWRSMIKYNINSFISSKIVIYNIIFKSKKPSLINGDGLSRAADIGIEIINCMDFQIKYCRFENFGNAAISIKHNDSIASGLINHNEFVHNCKGYDALGLGYGVVVYGENKVWIKDPKFGSKNFIFIEDNVFDYHRHSVAAGGCALYVFRYNIVKNNVAGNTAHAIDAHEANLVRGSENCFSTRAIEVYKNTIINTTFKDGTKNCPDGTPIVSGRDADWLTECAIRPRGGEAVIHDNVIQGYRFGIGPVVANSNLGTYPIPYQVGYLGANMYVWGNTYTPYNKTGDCIEFYNYTPKFLFANKEYFLQKKPNYTSYEYPHKIFK